MIWTGGGVLSYILVLSTGSITANMISTEAEESQDDLCLLQVDFLLVLDVIGFGRHDEGG